MKRTMITALMIALLGTFGMLNTLPAAAEARTLKFDVAENGKRFVFDEAPVDADGLPAYGNAFVTEGYMYPEGTLSCHADGDHTVCSGTNPDGSPEFPDKVVGRWSCRGWFVGDGAKTTTGAWVVTTQIYDFGEIPGDETLVSDGYELVDIGVAGGRAITGGTGKYRRAHGEAQQILLGYNPSDGVSLQFEIKVK